MRKAGRGLAGGAPARPGAARARPGGKQCAGGPARVVAEEEGGHLEDVSVVHKHVHSAEKESFQVSAVGVSTMMGGAALPALVRVLMPFQGIEI